MTDEGKLNAALDCAAVGAYFENVTATAEDFTATVDKVNKKAKKLSAAAHRELLMAEGKAIGTSADMLLEELDNLLAERCAYNDMLRKRADFWKVAGHRMERMKEKTTEDTSVASCGDTSQTLSSSNASSLLQTSVNGSMLSDKSNKIGSNERKPRLSDFGFSKETLDFLQGAESAKPMAAQPGTAVQKPPSLDSYKFDTINMSDSADGDLQGQAKRAVGVVRKQPPEMPLVLASCTKKPAVVNGVSNVMTNSFEKHEIADPAAHHDDGSKRSAGSMNGSFLADRPANEYGSAAPTVGPLVRGDLGFDDKYCFDESTATLANITAPVLPAAFDESLGMKPSAIRKPVLPELKTISLDSPSS